MADTVEPDDLATAILAAGVQIGGATWGKIKNATELYVRGFAQSIADIARGVANGGISSTDGKIYAQNAALSFGQLLANVTQALLHGVQAFLRKVFGLFKDLINRALPLPIL